MWMNGMGRAFALRGVLWEFVAFEHNDFFVVVRQHPCREQSGDTPTDDNGPPIGGRGCGRTRRVHNGSPQARGRCWAENARGGTVRPANSAIRNEHISNLLC